MNAAIYIRKSREEANKPSHRLQVQREQLPAHAISLGWTPHIYDDGHASAARGKTDDLRERARLEADIRSGKINLILTIELSRLSRDDSLQDYVAWLHLCSEKRVKLATLSRILDPAQHSDWMLLLMEGGFSSVEMKILQARMKEGRAHAYSAGKYLGGPVPEPYRFAGDGKLIIDQNSLAKMQQLWTLAETKSARATANELGLPHIFVRRAIADDRLLFYQARRIDPETGCTITCDWPPCLDTEQVERIKAGRRSGKRGYQRPHAGSLLSSMNIFTCGYCGRTIRSWNNHRLRPSGKTDIYHHYGCKANETKRLCERSRLIPQDIIDDKVTNNLLSTIAHADDLRNYWIAAHTGDQTAPKQDTEKQINNLLAKKQRLTAAIVEGLIDFADAKKARSVIDAEMETVKAQRISAAEPADTDEPDWNNLVLTRDEWQEMTATEQRTVIAGAVKGISLYASYLIIEYRFPRSTTGETTTRIHLPPALRSGKKPAETTPQ